MDNVLLVLAFNSKTFGSHTRMGRKRNRAMNYNPKETCTCYRGVVRLKH